MSDKQFHGRTLARSQALQLLFQAEAAGRSVADVLEGEYALSQGPLDDYGRELALGADSMKTVLDAIISSASQNWSLGRMPAVDRNLLRISVYEMLCEEEVAIPVTIDECVELAKAYGTDDSSKFVNGVLGRVAKDVEAGVDVVSEAKRRIEEQRREEAERAAAREAEEQARTDEDAATDGYEEWVPDPMDGSEEDAAAAEARAEEERRREEAWGKPYGYGMELTGGISQPEDEEDEDGDGE